MLGLFWGEGVVRHMGGMLCVSLRGGKGLEGLLGWELYGVGVVWGGSGVGWEF